jgi:hypothetical protein
MLKKTHVGGFNKHLGEIQQARVVTDKVITGLSPVSDCADEAMGMAWQATFELISEMQKKKELNLDKLQDFAALFYKLGQGQSQSQSVAQKAREFAMLRERLQATTEGLSAEVRNEFERAFNIMAGE